MPSWPGFNILRINADAGGLYQAYAGECVPCFDECAHASVRRQPESLRSRVDENDGHHHAGDYGHAGSPDECVYENGLRIEAG